MSNRRVIVWLTLLLVATVGANVLLSWYGSPAGRAHALQRRTLTEATFTPVRVEIARGGSPAAVLEKSGRWRLTHPYSASVNDEAVLRLVDALVFSPVDDSLTESELLRLGRTRADFGLDAPTLSVAMGDGAQTVRVDFGLCTPATKGVYVAVDGIDSVFIVPVSVRAAADLPPEAFRTRSVFPFGPESVVSFDVKRPSGQLLAFTRADDSWRVGDQPASAARVREFLRLASTAQAHGFVWPVGATNEAESASTALLSGYGLDPESATTVSLRCTDGTDRRFSLGNDAGEKLVYALVQNGSAVVTLDAALKDAALQDAVKFADSRVFPYDESAVASFSLADGDVGYVVARDSAGGWRLDSPVAAAADAETVSLLLGRLLSLSSSDIASEGIRVTVNTNTAPAVVSPSRLLGRSRLEDLRSKDVLKIDPAVVKRIVSLSGMPGAKPVSLVFSRDRRVWNMESGDEKGEADAKGVAAVLSVLAPLRAERIVALKASPSDLARFGLEKPHHTIAIDQDKEGAVRRNILIGGSVKGGRYATVGSADAIFVLSNHTVAKLLSRLITE